MYITIFVEGNESLFLQNLILKIAPELNQEEVLITTSIQPSEAGKNRINIFNSKGVTNLHLSKVNFEKTIAHGGVNLVIYDADDPSKDFGGFATRQAYLEQQKSEHSLKFDTFLFPDNQNDGDYETLLEGLIVETHRGVLDCFDGYRACLKAKNPQYKAPGNKEKMYSYVAVMAMEKKEEDRFKKRNTIKQDDFLFERADIWNLDSPKLQPLKDFLLKYLQPKAI